MKGLFYKNLINLKQVAKYYTIVLIFWTFLGIINESTIFLSAVTMIFAAIIPMTVMSYDEKVNWERFALTMPVTKMDLILSKYYLLLSLNMACAVFSFIINAITGADLMFSATTGIAFMFAGIILGSILLPFNFKFGTEKARIIMMIIIFLPVVIAILFGKFNLILPVEFLSQSTMTILLYTFIATILIVGISIRISKHIYDHKEF